MIDLFVDLIQFLFFDKPFYFILFILVIFYFAHWRYRLRRGKFVVLWDDDDSFKFSSDFGVFNFIKKENKIELNYFEKDQQIVLYVDDIRQISLKRELNTDVISKFLDSVSFAVDHVDPLDLTINLFSEAVSDDFKGVGEKDSKMMFAIVINAKDYKDYPLFIISQAKAGSFYDEFVLDILTLLRLVEYANFKARDVFELVRARCSRMNIDVYDYS
ncbi:MAG: hypothetical protein A2Y03_03770 [Omnitrophica WOR_2 bacterium GWF2_38_59]|nr:MAG: hypothetical protein A2Y03_03770 [Omnitrophica WOR_2 bacterium GWF2_38_59]OGX47137.1 MAG: hypothetical protein A2243_04805 [Omnitrophica WOR_2 bacterium RIFOXYA2_FULL_38_17]OGX54891.1 MAG: hypothetical protein A2267_01325 [Omnitrophica WOR_2 bacterium RIFOXYA12_FULL_38_10]OGX57045.1 MAG: hypothetical protein A2447_02730 [Omnitrophica WOR_2 bacterium RIFOXYC2_FULL_38_12]OGX57121.1 MAG: hypothetical protein A2306_01035 [Omnitrophica WOR_2 bacterium RIFOXYB2_FULL_38_16]HBG62411.1 hypothet